MALGKDKEAFRDELLRQDIVHSERHEEYRKEVETMLEKEEKALRKEKWITGPMWIYLVVLCATFLLLGGFSEDSTTRLWFGILACFWFIFGAVFLLKYFINRNRVEMLKEFKEIQLQISELRDEMSKE
jgi:hypothetical protein